MIIGRLGFSLLLLWVWGGVRAVKLDPDQYMAVVGLSQEVPFPQFGPADDCPESALLTCSNGSVVFLNISRQELSQVPPDVFDLTRLTELCVTLD